MNDLSGLRFRSSMNGFRKKDVAQYIDALTRNAAAEKAGLEEALAAAKEMSGQLGEKLSVSEKETASLKEECERLSSELKTSGDSLASCSASLESLRSEIASLRERISSLESEKTGLQARIGEYESRAQAMEAEKRVITELELAARLRAEESEASAKERAAAIMEKCRKDFMDTRSVVDHYKADTDVMIGSAEKHLSSLQSLIEDFKHDMDESKKGLDEFSLEGKEDRENG